MNEPMLAFTALAAETRPSMDFRTACQPISQNEGRGFGKKESADYQFWTELMFWKANLLAK